MNQAVDLITGEVTVPTSGIGSFAEAERQRKQSLYIKLEHDIFERVLNELKFPDACKTHGRKAQSLKTLLEDLPNSDKAAQARLSIRANIEERIVENIRHHVGYPASATSQDPGEVVHALQSCFPDWLSDRNAQTEGLEKIDTIAAEEIKAFRASAVGKTA